MWKQERKTIALIRSATKTVTYTLKKSITSGDNGEAPDPIKRTLPPSFSFILENTSLSQIGDGFRPRAFEQHSKNRTQSNGWKQYEQTGLLST